MRTLLSIPFLLGSVFLLLQASCRHHKSTTEAQKDSVSTVLLGDAEKEMRAMDSLRRLDSAAQARLEIEKQQRQLDSARKADSVAAAQQERRHPPALPVEPRYKEGRAAMDKFISGHVKYPAAAKKKGIRGVVYVDFVVAKDGTLKDFKIRQGLGYGCDEEAIRVLKLMPAWEPGRKEGKTVDMEYNVGVTFGMAE